MTTQRFLLLSLFPAAIAWCSPLTASASNTQDLMKGPFSDHFLKVSDWRGVANVAAVEGQTAFTADGQGAILINGLEKNNKIPYLTTKSEFGDARVELEFMIPKGSNAGVYMMGRYETQILDSFGKIRVGTGDLGGIYQRWDASLPKGQQGFEGTRPKLNAAKAPGEWQTMEITFRAPRFTKDGKKIRNATFEKVIVNGQIVQEFASTSGPTRSSPLVGDAETGPIAIQGDHGPIAIRRFLVTPLPDPDQARIHELDAYWAEVSRCVHTGDFAAYQATCHQKAIIVAGNKQLSYPMRDALERWKKDFADTKSGSRKSAVAFRFSHRYGDATTAHEAGVFRYTWNLGEDAPKDEYITFESLLIKEADGWKTLMEYQKTATDQAAWDALAAP